MSDLELLSLRVERTRRNIVKAGPILASAVALSLATTKIAVAKDKDKDKDPKCLLKGTRIQTAEGECKVEDLAIGDLLPTMYGGLRPVQWIGRYPIRKSNPSKPWVKDALPVRIARSALALNVPRADLYVTASHSLLINGVLVPAEALINGTTITRYEAREYDEMEFFHIKLESHDVIYAEGALAETLLNVEESAVNFAEYLRQYGTRATDEIRCAPYVHIWGGRVELMSRLRSALSPWIDLRNRADVLRDRLEEHGIGLLPQEELLGAQPFDTLIQKLCLASAKCRKRAEHRDARFGGGELQLPAPRCRFGPNWEKCGPAKQDDRPEALLAPSRGSAKSLRFSERVNQ